MRILNKFNSYVAMAAMGLVALTACNNDDIDYSSSTYPNAASAYFSVQGVKAVQIGTGDTEKGGLLVYRPAAGSSATVNLEWEGETQNFVLPTSVTFGEEDLIAEIVISFNENDLEPAHPYDLKVTIPGTETTPYTQNYAQLELTYFPMSEWELFGYDEALGRDGIGTFDFSLYYSMPGYGPVRVLSRYSLINPDMMDFDFQWLIDDDNPDLGYESFLTASSTDGGETLTVPVTPFAYNSNYGTVYVASTYLYFSDLSEEDNDSYFDDVTGTFYLDVVYFVNEGYFDYGYETCTLNGYLDTNDYSVTLTDLGMTTIADENYQLVSFSWGEAVSLVEYVVVDTESVSDEEGNLSDELLEGIAEDVEKGNLDATIVPKKGTYSFSFPKGGDYTLVAIGYKDEGNAEYAWKSVQGLSFTYKTTDPNEGWTDLGYAPYTDTFLSNMYGFPAPTYYVLVQESETEPGLYRLVDPYGADYPENEPGDWDEDVTSYLYINATNPDCVWIPECDQTVDWGHGALACYSLAAYYMAQGATEDDIIEMGVGGTLEDGVITFPEGTLLFGYGSYGWYYTNYAFGEEYDDDGNVIDQWETGMFKLDLSALTANPVDAASHAKARAIKKAHKAPKAQKALKAAKNVKKAHKAPKAVDCKNVIAPVSRQQKLNSFLKRTTVSK